MRLYVKSVTDGRGSRPVLDDVRLRRIVIHVGAGFKPVPSATNTSREVTRTAREAFPLSFNNLLEDALPRDRPSIDAQRHP